MHTYVYSANELIGKSIAILVHNFTVCVTEGNLVNVSVSNVFELVSSHVNITCYI